jgi:hypothetical protein
MTMPVGSRRNNRLHSLLTLWHYNKQADLCGLREQVTIRIALQSYPRMRGIQWCRHSRAHGNPFFNPEENLMQIRKIALFAATLFAAGSAFGFHCPQDMKKIDDALAKNPQLSAAQMDEVKKYRADGEALHKAGKHQESLDTLSKAEKILGIAQ